MIFRKWGGGSMAVWNFSENSSPLEGLPYPKTSGRNTWYFLVDILVMQGVWQQRWQQEELCFVAAFLAAMLFLAAMPGLAFLPQVLPTLFHHQRCAGPIREWNFYRKHWCFGLVWTLHCTLNIMKINPKWQYLYPQMLACYFFLSVFCWQ